MRLLAPPINDISTDLNDPPPLAGRSSDYPERLKATVAKHYAHLRPLSVSQSASDVLAAAAELVRSNGWRLEQLDEKNGLLHGVAITKLFKFKDDLTVRVRSQGTGSLVDMRSSSRLGKGDFGANAERIESFFAALRARLG